MIEALKIAGGIVPFAALLALVGVIINQAFIGSRTRYEHVCTRIERAYLLSQKLYDGHKKEIDKVEVTSRNCTQQVWYEQRGHPGEHMNEIKMIVAMYGAKHGSKLKSLLSDVDQHHQSLKTRLNAIDESFSGGASQLLRNTDELKLLKKDLINLEKSIDALKQGLASTVRKL